MAFLLYIEWNKFLNFYYKIDCRHHPQKYFNTFVQTKNEVIIMFKNLNMISRTISWKNTVILITVSFIIKKGEILYEMVMMVFTEFCVYNCRMYDNAYWLYCTEKKMQFLQYIERFNFTSSDIFVLFKY